MNICRFHTDAGAVSSSCPDSPEKTVLAEKRHHQLPANFGTRHTSRHADDDLDKLADKFKSIQANLEDISKKTLTPVNSPRREKQKVWILFLCGSSFFVKPTLLASKLKISLAFQYPFPRVGKVAHTLYNETLNLADLSNKCTLEFVKELRKLNTF